MFVGGNLPLAAQKITLSTNGTTGYRIAAAADPTPAEKTAVAELSKYLQLATGARFSIVTETNNPAGERAIYVGQTKYAAGKGLDFSTLGPEEWVIRTTSDGNLILGGGRPRGTLYAVYEFLETQLGCRWLDETNDVIPSFAALEIPELNRQGKPYFRNRQFFDLLDWYPRSQAFKVRNRGTCYVGAEYGWGFTIGRPHQHHTFYYYSHEWPKDQGNLYSHDKEGKPLIAVSGEGPGQICLTNPEVRKRVLAQLKEHIAQDRKDAAVPGAPPYPTVYDISQNDNTDYCTCPQCRALIEREGSPSGPLLDFINAIAAGIRKEYPDVFIRTFACTYSATPPRNLKAADNVLIHIALLGVEFGNNKGPRDNINELKHSTNQISRDLIGKWGKKASHLALWDYGVIYLAGGPEPEPYINIHRFAPDLAFYKAQHAEDVFIESEYPHCTNFFGLKRYLVYKLMQNPDQPAAPLLTEFMNGYYGKAAPVMEKLLAYMEQRQKENDGPLGRTDLTSRKYLDINYFRTVFSLLDQAEKLTADNVRQAANVRRERVPLLSALLMRWHRLDNPEKYFDGAALLQQYKEVSLAVIDYYFPTPDTQTFRKECLDNREKIIQRFAHNLVPAPLPAKFKNRSAVDLPWACFRTDIGRSKLIDDPEAVGGKAIELGPEVSDRTKNGQTDFGIYNWNENKVVCATILKNADLPQDEKYHLIKIGRADFVNDSQAYFYGGANWEIRCDLYRMFPRGSSYDGYLSVKFQGPDYVSGSHRKNSIRVERLILVPNK